ncbi:Protein FAR1-RELATED SEQUENCE 6 [Acorus gramineus]|uniref:Protein FAR1-RELATED SEQUENCE n=1 Tax=Acorus gramineus TaxID=55184 RepID=A0AAV9BSK8_ACOGR|nr:Protein FAR1-RELATED SEQUENCE 6 [Acorus gramineus]
MEEQLSGIYTRNIFQKFQVELKQLIHVCASPVKVDDPFTTYEVKEYGKEKQGKYEVLFNAIEQDVQCICRSFESRGILCRHALCVLKYEGLIEIPSKYIVNRWKKDFKRLHALSSPPLADIPVERGDNLYTHCMSQIADIVKIGSVSDDRYRFVLKVMSEAKEKILEFDSSHGETSSGDRNIVVAKDTFGSYGVGKVSDPASVHHESHLPSKRKGLLLEKTKHQSRKGLVVSQHDVPPIGLSTHFGSHIGPRERFNLMV